MRTFIAVELSKEQKEKLAEFQKELKKCRADLKIVENENLHLTLRFLGEISEAEVTSVKKFLAKIKFTKFQIETFTNFISLLSQKKIYAPYVHCANSAALIKYPESRFSLVRPGISLYGINPFQGEKKLKLKKVLSWKSRIVFLKEAPAKTRISYLGTFVTKRASKIATAAFGYADGYRRSLSNKGVVLVNGKRVPVIGRVTMDMTMLDVTECPKVHVGDEVVLIGEQGKETISVEEMAELCQTSAYEIFCNIAARVARVDLV